MPVKCRNPACDCETYTFVYEYKEQQKMVKNGDLRMPIRLTCTKCKTVQKAYVMNSQLREIVKAIHHHDNRLLEFVEFFSEVWKMAEMSARPWWKRILGMR